MAKAKVSTSELSEFRGLVSNQSASIQEGINSLCDTLSQWLQQISEEKQRCANLQTKCQDAITDVEARIEEIEEQIAVVEAALANTPPYIEVTHTDAEGETYTTLEPNPAYTALECQLNDLQSERDKYQQKLDKLQALLQKIEETISKLDSSEQQINELMQSLQQVSATAVDNVSRAEMLLDRAIQALEGYLAVSIGGGSGGHSSAGGSVSSSSGGSAGGSSGIVAGAGNKGWSELILSYINTEGQMQIYQNANLTQSEINGRPCLMKNIDYDYVDEKTGLTNRELMARGRSPIDASTGEKIELHHMGQEYDSPFAELAENSEHGDGNHKELHPKTSNSWRNDEAKKKEYQKEKIEYWKTRSKRGI